MRVVRELAALDGELDGRARPRPPSAFGDGEVFVEPYVERRPARRGADPGRRPRHGLGARHPGLLPPAPPPEGHRGGPGARPGRRARAGRCTTPAVAAARAVGYRARAPSSSWSPTSRAALPGDEHPPPGRTPRHGSRVRPRPGGPADPGRRGRAPSPSDAAAARRPRRRGPPLRRGPGTDWQPQTGTLHRLAVPGGVRLDTGYTDGDTDRRPLRPDARQGRRPRPHPRRGRPQTRRRPGTRPIHGPVTNRDLLVRSLRHPEFTAARIDTGFYDRHLADTDRPRRPDAARPACAAALADAHGRARPLRRLAQPRLPAADQALPRRAGRHRARGRATGTRRDGPGRRTACASCTRDGPASSSSKSTA